MRTMQLDTRNINLATVDALVSPNTRAMVTIVYASCPADLDELLSMDRKHGVPAIKKCSLLTLTAVCRPFFLVSDEPQLMRPEKFKKCRREILGPRDRWGKDSVARYLRPFAITGSWIRSITSLSTDIRSSIRGIPKRPDPVRSTLPTRGDFFAYVFHTLPETNAESDEDTEGVIRIHYLRL